MGVTDSQLLPDFFENSRLRNVVLVHVDDALAAFRDRVYMLRIRFVYDVDDAAVELVLS